MNKSNYFKSKLCRICETEEDLLNLLNDTTDSLVDKLKSFVDFHVSFFFLLFCTFGGVYHFFVKLQEEDDLPKYICEECKQLLEISYKFKDQCLATDLKFRIFLEEIKRENESIFQNSIEYLEVKQEDEESSADDNLLPDEDQFEDKEDSQNASPIKDNKKKSKAKKKWPCPTCHEVFSYLDYLEHKKVHGKKRYQCDICEKWFEHNYVLTKHKETHLNLERVECETCHNTFKSDQILQRHIQLTHQNILVAFCELCGKGFKLRSDLTSHLRSHSDERNYSCEICDKKFKTNTNLHKHKRTHLPKEERPGHVCEICSKISFSSGSHKNHMRTHTGETPFQCKICPMKFSQYASLHRHQNVHTGERKFKCELCGSDFVRKEHLNTHMRVHIKYDTQMV